MDQQIQAKYALCSARLTNDDSLMGNSCYEIYLGALDWRNFWWWWVCCTSWLALWFLDAKRLHQNMTSPTPHDSSNCSDMRPLLPAYQIFLNPRHLRNFMSIPAPLCHLHVTTSTSERKRHWAKNSHESQSLLCYQYGQLQILFIASVHYWSVKTWTGHQHD